MLELILLILKILGIVLVSVLIFVIFSIIFVLIVPVKYKFQFIKNDKLYDDYKCFFKISCCAGLLKFKYKHTNSKQKIVLKVLGIPFNNILKIKKNKIKKTKSNKQNTTTSSNIMKKQPNLSETSNADNKFKSKELIKNDGSENDNIEKNSIEKDISEKLILEKDSIENTISNKGMIDKINNDKICKTNCNNQYIAESDSIKKENIKNKKLRKKRKTKFSVKNFLRSIRELPIIIKDIFLTTKRIILKLLEDISQLGDNLIIIKEFFDNTNNRNGMKEITLVLKKTIRYIMPRKYKCVVKFGFDDPAVTGQTLGIIAMTIPIHKDFLKIQPDFNNNVFECNINVKGKIFLIKLLIVYIKLYFNDYFKYLLNDFYRLKEEL